MKGWLLAGAGMLGLCASAAAQAVPTPESILGFTPGAERKLVEWPILVDYYRKLAAASDRVEFRELGKTTLGAPFVALVISSPANMGRLEAIRRANAKLADPRTIASAAEREALLRDGKAIVLITSSIHSTEVGGHLTPVIVADRLARGTTPDVLSILDNVVLLLVPTLNPDGVTIVSRWYNSTLGTPAEGTDPPELYHHYTGHDNNRDWYAFTQAETRLTIDSLYNVWYPQIVHDIHQMGSNGARLFVPPYLDPVEPNVDPLLVQGVNSLGTHMAWVLSGQGKKGISVNATYDAWTPARAYQHYHAAVRILSETASGRLATSIDLPFDRLSAQARGFSPKESSWNFADPWLGGRWTLADIVDYQSAGALALLGHAAQHRDHWLRTFLTVGDRAVRGWAGWPYAYVLADSGSERLHTVLGILHRGGVEIRQALQPIVAGGRTHATGSHVVVLRQPFAAFAKSLLEPQVYPDLRVFPGGPPRAPYDVTAHTLPLLMGVQAMLVRDSIRAPLSAPITPPAPRYGYAGLSRASAGSGPPARLGLYTSYDESMDEGWTRWVFDNWRIPYTSLVDSVVRAGSLKGRFDVIVLPDQSPQALRNGVGDPYPPKYRGGIGQQGMAALREFVSAGGTLVALNGASEFAIAMYEEPGASGQRLPVRNVVAGKSDEEFYAPGSIFRVVLDTAHSLARGMPSSSVAWFEAGPAFDVLDTVRTRVIARYPSTPDSVLLSGWVLHPEVVAGKAAMVEARVGNGRVVLFGFRPQYRAQSMATFPLLFNALMPEGRK